MVAMAADTECGKSGGCCGSEGGEGGEESGYRYSSVLKGEMCLRKFVEQ